MANHICPSWAGYILLSPLRKLFENPEKIFKPYVKQGMVVLEPGCGMGYFTLPLARMVGPSGRIIAVDIQEKMLSSLERRTRRANLSEIVEIRAAKPGRMGLKDLEGAVDFVAAIHMVHEIPDPEAFFGEMIKTMKSNATMLIMEPKGHVSPKDFEKSIALARRTGFVPDPMACDIKSRCALLHK
jgi:ubiquinone/menaquinone biosynthesis C-methylase UbiE